METYLRDVEFNIANGSAFDDFRALFNDTFYEYDALILETGSPFNHLLANFFRGNGKKCLD